MAITEAQLLSLLRAEGFSHPLLPIAVKIFMESFQTGERALTSEIPLGPLAVAVDPAGELGAILGRLSRGDVEPRGGAARLGAAAGEQIKAKRTRKKNGNDKIMKRALREANAKARLKNGSWRKGWNQSRVMTEAHRLRRKYSPSTRKGQVRKTARRAYTRR